MRGLPERGPDPIENQVATTENEIVWEAQDAPAVLGELGVAFPVVKDVLRRVV